MSLVLVFNYYILFLFNRNCTHLNFAHDFQSRRMHYRSFIHTFKASQYFSFIFDLNQVRFDLLSYNNLIM
uniref:Hypothetical secreted peptide n=1 Tax=Glossina morsitans morsitans TaxID=37546 RepID=D3TSR0_GLOMM